MVKYKCVPIAFCVWMKQKNAVAFHLGGYNMLWLKTPHMGDTNVGNNCLMIRSTEDIDTDLFY